MVLEHNLRRERQRRYEQSEKGKVTRRRYERSEKGKATEARYLETDNGIQKTRKRNNKATRAYQLRNPEMHRAHLALHEAVRTARIVKPDRCSRCDRPGPLQGHHHDYSKPLDVIWLCDSCHRLEHS